MENKLHMQLLYVHLAEKMFQQHEQEQTALLEKPSFDVVALSYCCLGCLTINPLNSLQGCE